MKIWRIYGVIVTVLAAIAFTPLVIPYGVTEPYVIGLPRTLWSGLLISICIYIVLVVAMITSNKEE